MIISSGHLYAKQISAGEAPSMPDNVFFENGVFNRKYIPQGFDFANNTYDINNPTSYDYPEDATYPADKIDTGTIFELFGHSNSAVAGERWTMEDGCITYRHNPPAGSSSSRRYSERSIVIPIVNALDFLADYAFLCVRCKCETEMSTSQFIIVSCHYSEATTLPKNGMGMYVDADLPLDWYVIAADTDQMERTPTYISIFLDISERINNPLVQKFQIDKIYASNTDD